MWTEGSFQRNKLPSKSKLKLFFFLFFGTGDWIQEYLTTEPHPQPFLFFILTQGLTKLFRASLNYRGWRWNFNPPTSASGATGVTSTHRHPLLKLCFELTYSVSPKPFLNKVSSCEKSPKWADIGFAGRMPNFIWLSGVGENPPEIKPRGLAQGQVSTWRNCGAAGRR